MSGQFDIPPTVAHHLAARVFAHLIDDEAETEAALAARLRCPDFRIPVTSREGLLLLSRSSAKQLYPDQEDYDWLEYIIGRVFTPTEQERFRRSKDVLVKAVGP